jgi:serine/threonine-protein kinase
MGEVYRADDLKLGQPVALKFLPREVERDEGRLQRFLNEVRMALKVTHPNVTRVYDIGEEDGHHYISMEFVDGEDLSSLLRRIGRLPEDKAVQVARQICAGLSAAHDQGVLHRDLKPANVMLDGRGQIKITDFGLAGLEQTIVGAEAQAGTPAYMAPEQWTGQEVTAQSDLYALGLVLYELFTGQSAFGDKSPAEILRIQQDDSSTLSSPSTVITGIDPAVERVILGCLEKEPAQRPSSALVVSAALPGGDPLAAALAAGETPSPELVAQAGETAGLTPRPAAACIAALIAGLVFWVTLGNLNQLVGYSPPAKSPQYLAETARQIVEDLGYEEEPADSLYTYAENEDYIDHLRDSNERAGHWEVLRIGQPASLLFAYRESPSPMTRWSEGQLTRAEFDPPMDEPGMIRVMLDLQGRLTSLLAVPPRREDAVEWSDSTLDWSPLLEAAGLDSAELEPVEPTWAPHVFVGVREGFRFWSLGATPTNSGLQASLEDKGFSGPYSSSLQSLWQVGWVGGMFAWGAAIARLRFGWHSF